MKNTITFIAILLFFSAGFAQQGINYKAIITDNGAVLQNQAIQVQFSILRDGTTLEYQETHSPTTDANGIIILNIGEGSVVSGLYNSIHWYAQQFLKVEIDTGSGYEDFGTTAFKTVPYAIYAENGNGARKINDLTDAKKDVTSIFLGSEAGSADEANNDNTAVGNFALRYNSTGTSNNAIGFGALHVNVTGYSNVANGSNSLSSNTSGNENIALGAYTLTENITGSHNTALGKNAGYNSLGDSNIFLGYKAGYNEIGSDKLYIENSNSATPLIGGDFSTDEVTINGSIAIIDGTQGVDKVLTSDVNGKATWQTVDEGVTQINDLSDAVFDGQSIYIGYNSGINDDTSNYNAALGWETMKNNTSGRQNVSFGAQALFYNETGSYNVVLGSGALYNNISGSNNVVIGEDAGSNTLGDGNILIGKEAGLNETGSNKLYIENSNSVAPLIGGDFTTDEVTINGSLEITGDVTSKITSSFSGTADMKAYIYGSIGPDGVNVTAISSNGFIASKIGTGSYKIDSAGLNYYTVSTTMRYGAIGFITIEKFGDYMIVRTYNTDGIAEDRGFDFIVFKK